MSQDAIDYAKLEAAYEAATAESEPAEFPNFAVGTLDGAARIRAKVTGESLPECRLWLLDNAELVDVDGIGRVHRLVSDAGTLLMYPD